MHILNINPEWHIDQALELIRDMQPALGQFGYHVALGGGVLNNGYSEKDLDLYFLPMGDTGTDADLPLLLAYLSEKLGKPAPIGYSSQDTSYPADPLYGENRYTYVSNNRRIDVFIATR